MGTVRQRVCLRERGVCVWAKRLWAMATCQWSGPCGREIACVARELWRLTCPEMHRD